MKTKDSYKQPHKATFEEVNYTKQRIEILSRTAKMAFQTQDDMFDINVMIDIETLGKGPLAPIASIGIVPFALDGTIMYDLAVHERFDTDAQIKAGAVPDASTVDWWSKQDDLAKQELTGNGDLEQFLLWCSNVYMHQLRACSKFNQIKIWSKSPSFDLAIIGSWTDFFEMPRLCAFYQQEDVRTTLNQASMIGVNKNDIPTQKDLAELGEVAHNAYDDAILQIRQIRVIHKRMQFLQKLSETKPNVA